LLDAFADGVCFVSLAPISDPDLVLPTIAQTLDVKERGARPLLDQLKALLKDQHLLLVLDNFEEAIRQQIPLIGGMESYHPVWLTKIFVE